MAHEPYDVDCGVWLHKPFGTVMYLDARRSGTLHLVRLIAEHPGAVVYLSSAFDRVFTLRLLAARRLGMLRGRRVLLAPRGEFTDAALSIRAFRKAVFLSVARALGLYRGIVMHVSSDVERSAVAAALGAAELVFAVAPDLASPIHGELDGSRDRRATGEVKAVFIARIARIKNVHLAIQGAVCARSPVTLDLYGPVEDPEYWEECLPLIKASRGRVRHLGPLEPGEVGPVLQKYDVFVMPSASESFGHSIVEALSCGLPVVVGTEVPWQDVQEFGAGFVLKELTSESIAFALDAYFRKSEQDRLHAASKARDYAAKIFDESDSYIATRDMFRGVEAVHNISGGVNV